MPFSRLQTFHCLLCNRKWQVLSPPITTPPLGPTPQRGGGTQDWTLIPAWLFKIEILYLFYRDCPACSGLTYEWKDHQS